MDMDRIVTEVQKTLDKLKDRGEIEGGIVAEESRLHCGMVETRLCLGDAYLILHMFESTVEHYLATLDSGSQSAIADAREEWEGIIRRFCAKEQARRAA